MFPEQNSLPWSRPDSNTLAFSRRLPMKCTTKLWELHVGKLVLHMPPSAAVSLPARDSRAEEPSCPTAPQRHFGVEVCVVQVHTHLVVLGLPSWLLMQV